MNKPRSIYMWENLDKTIQRNESWMDLISKKKVYMISNIVPKTMKIIHSNFLRLSESLCRLKNHLSLRMGLYHTVHTFMNVYLSSKVVFIQYKTTRERHFHHLEINYCLHKRKFPWQVSLLCINWNIMISVIMILDVSFQVVWCLMTSSWI